MVIAHATIKRFLQNSHFMKAAPHNERIRCLDVYQQVWPQPCQECCLLWAVSAVLRVGQDSCQGHPPSQQSVSPAAPPPHWARGYGSPCGFHLTHPQTRCHQPCVPSTSHTHGWATAAALPAPRGPRWQVPKAAPRCWLFCPSSAPRPQDADRLAASSRCSMCPLEFISLSPHHVALCLQDLRLLLTLKPLVPQVILCSLRMFLWHHLKCTSVPSLGLSWSPGRRAGFSSAPIMGLLGIECSAAALFAYGLCTSTREGSLTGIFQIRVCDLWCVHSCRFCDVCHSRDACQMGRVSSCLGSGVCFRTSPEAPLDDWFQDIGDISSWSWRPHLIPYVSGDSTAYYRDAFTRLTKNSVFSFMTSVFLILHAQFFVSQIKNYYVLSVYIPFVLSYNMIVWEEAIKPAQTHTWSEMHSFS